jgi:hypothetical protein
MRHISDSALQEASPFAAVYVIAKLIVAYKSPCSSSVNHNPQSWLGTSSASLPESLFTVDLKLSQLVESSQMAEYDNLKLNFICFADDYNVLVLRSSKPQPHPEPPRKLFRQTYHVNGYNVLLVSFVHQDQEQVLDWMKGLDWPDVIDALNLDGATMTPSRVRNGSTLIAGYAPTSHQGH